MLCTKDGGTGGSQSDVVKMMCTKDRVKGGNQSDICICFKFGSTRFGFGEQLYTYGILASFLSSTVLTVEAFLTGNVMSEVDMSP
jgi:hypothetical protein